MLSQTSELNFHTFLNEYCNHSLVIGKGKVSTGCVLKVLKDQGYSSYFQGRVQGCEC